MPETSAPKPKTGSFSLKYLNFISNFRILKKTFIDFLVYSFFLLVLIDGVLSFIFGYAPKLLAAYKIKKLLAAHQNIPQYLSYLKVANDTIATNWGNIWHLFLKSLYALLAYPLLFMILNRTGKKPTERFIRGSNIIAVDELKKQIKSKGLPTSLPIGEFKLPIAYEVNHGFLLGRPGVGKTVLLLQVIEEVLRRKKKMLLYDYKSDFMNIFYDKDRDFIFNPIDKRGVNWNVFDEIKTDFDIESIAGSLIPTPADSKDKYWTDAARGVFAGVLKYLFVKFKHPNHRLLWDTLCKSPNELYEICKEAKNGSDKFLTPTMQGVSPTVTSVISTLTQHTICFKYSANDNPEGKKFVISDWLNSDDSSILFIINYPEIQDTLSPFISLFIDLFSKKALNLEDSKERRLFMFLDEFGTLKKLPTLIQILTAGRSKGISFWIGIQDVGQIDNTYGKETRSTMLNACGIAVIYALSDAETAKAMSEKLGKKESISKKESFNLSAKNEAQSLSQSEEKSDKDIVTPSELINLPTLTAFVKIPNFDVVKTTFDYHKFSYPSSNTTPFIIKDEFSVVRGDKENEELDALLKALSKDDEDDEDFDIPDDDEEIKMNEDKVDTKFNEDTEEELNIARENNRKRRKNNSSSSIFNTITEDIIDTINENIEIVNDSIIYKHLKKVYDVSEV